MTTGSRGESPVEQAPYARRMDRESSVSYMDCLFSVLAGSEQTDERSGLMEMVASRAVSPRAICTTPTTRASMCLRASSPLRRRADLRGRSRHVRVLAARRGPLLHLPDRLGPHALNRRAGRIGKALQRPSLQRAGRGHDVADAFRSARSGTTGGDGSRPGQLRH
jgi:hypothetical protein